MLCCRGRSFNKRLLFALLSAIFTCSIINIVFTNPRLHFWSHHDHRPLSVRRRTCHVISHVTDAAAAAGIWPRNDSQERATRIDEQTNYSRQLEQTLLRSNLHEVPIQTKIILRISEYNFYDWIEGRGRFANDRCPIANCLLTSNITEYRRSADALLITEINSRTVKQFLPKPANQIWIARHLESPLNSKIEPTAVRQLINWTTSYRLDSTVYYPFYLTSSVFVPRDSPDTSHNNANYAARRTRKVVWLATNPRDHNGRQNYVRELSRYIDVDVYGALGKLSCSWSDNLKCFETFSRHYKFYLAFENSNCRDYITEKVFRNAMENDLLPVVMGARPEDYSAVLPPNSFLHVDNFSSPRDLAEYLLRLDADDSLYNSYFQWKSTWTRRKQPGASYWCRLCTMLHAAQLQQYVTWYADYEDCWNGVCDAPWDSIGNWQTWRPQENSA